MRRAMAVVAMVVGVVVGVMAQEQGTKYGKALTLTELTKVSDIHANPEKFDGKRVQVQGPIVDVCQMMGCWLAIGSDQASQTIRFKVEDGVIVFPISTRGKTAKVEGVISVETLTVEQQIAQGEEMARDQKTTFDPKTITGPKVSVQIKGEGAIVF